MSDGLNPLNLLNRSISYFFAAHKLYQPLQIKQLRNPFPLNFSIILVLILATSCVPNKKIQYLQMNDVNADSDQFPKDSVLRTYTLSDFEYRLQPEDILAIQVYSLTQDEFDFFSLKRKASGSANVQFQNLGQSLVNGYLIDINGEIEFPVVGKITLSGLTLLEAENKLKDIADKYLDNPVVEVKILNFRFTILGEVRSEGVYSSLNNRITVLEAIGLTGGFTDLADKSAVKVIRRSGALAEVYYLDLLNEEFVNSPHYFINQNDVIIIAPLKQRPFQNYFSKNFSLVLSSISILVVILNTLLIK